MKKTLIIISQISAREINPLTDYCEGGCINKICSDCDDYNEEEAKLKTYRVEPLNCYACQGGGCPVCSGFGFIYLNTGSIHEFDCNEETLTATPV